MPWRKARTRRPAAPIPTRRHSADVSPSPMIRIVDGTLDYVNRSHRLRDGSGGHRSLAVGERARGRIAGRGQDLGNRRRLPIRAAGLRRSSEIFRSGWNRRSCTTVRPTASLSGRDTHAAAGAALDVGSVARASAGPVLRSEDRRRSAHHCAACSRWSRRSI